MSDPRNRPDSRGIRLGSRVGFWQLHDGEITGVTVRRGSAYRTWVVEVDAEYRDRSTPTRLIHSDALYPTTRKPS